MPRYTYTISSFGGTVLPTANMRRATFVNDNGPGQTHRFNPVEAEVIGLGDRHVRAQPKGAFWEIHVELIAVNQTDLDAFYKIFDEEAGQVTLLATDGGGAVWRVSAGVVQVQRQSDRYFIVVIRVADPTWEENVQATDTQAAMSGASQAFALTNAGNRKARPTFTITPQAAKTDPFDADLLTMKGFIIPPKSGFPAARYPVELLDNPTHASSKDINHIPFIFGTKRAEVSGALAIDATSIPFDTITNGGPATKGLVLLFQQRALVNEPSNITAIQTEITYDTGTNGNPSVSGLVRMGQEMILYTGGGGGSTGTLTGCVRGYANTKPLNHNNNTPIEVVEQVSYTAGGGSSPGTLTTVVRGVGGTIAQVHSDNTAIYQSSMLLNGDDIRVKVNDLPVERWVGGTFSSGGALKVWTVLDMAAYLEKTLYRDISDSIDVIAFNEGVADLPERGLLAIYDHASQEHEIIHYTGRALSFLAITGVVRGLWNTTARAHVKGVPVNIIPSEDPNDPNAPGGSFERSTEGWSILNLAAVPVRTLEQRKFGEASLKVVTSGGLNDGTISPILSANANTEYMASGWIRREEGAVDIVLEAFDQDENVLDTSPALGTAIGEWFHVEFTFSTQAGDTGIKLAYRKDNDATGITFYLDGLQLETVPIGIHATPFGTQDGHADYPVVRYEVFGGKADAEPPNDPDRRRPAIGLHTSDNGQWRWGGYGNSLFTIDGRSRFAAAVGQVRRPVEWLPNPRRDLGNAADSLRLDVSKNEVRFVDKAKVAGKRLIDHLFKRLPAGVVKVEVDIQKRSDIRLVVRGLDGDGEGVELADEQDVEEATASLTLVPDDPLYGISISGVRAAVTGNDVEDFETNFATVFEAYQRIVLFQPTKISAIQLRLRESNAGSVMRFRIGLYESLGIYPNRDQAIVEFDRAVGSTSGGLTDADSSFTFNGANLDHAALETVEFKSSGGVVEVPAGIYWLKIETTEASASNELVFSRGQARTPNNIMFSVFGFDRTRPAWLRVIHELTSPVQEESALLNAAEAESDKEASFDGLACTFAFPVEIEREDALAADRYHCTATIKNTENSDEIVIDWWLKTGEQLVIDCEARTVTFIDANGNSSNALAAVTPGSVSDWFRLEPGVNNLEFNEDGMVDTDLGSVWRGRKV